MSTKISEDDDRLKRAYEPPAADDGIRILVDRLWLRAISKQALALDEWMKDIAPARSCAAGLGMTWPMARVLPPVRRRGARTPRSVGGVAGCARKGRITLVIFSLATRRTTTLLLSGTYSARPARRRDSQKAKKVILTDKAIRLSHTPSKRTFCLSTDGADDGTASQASRQRIRRGGRDAHAADIMTTASSRFDRNVNL